MLCINKLAHKEYIQDHLIICPRHLQNIYMDTVVSYIIIHQFLVTVFYNRTHDHVKMIHVGL